jgi:hypothetical protein
MKKQDIESELSYAYLHAVAAKAGMSCNLGNRHDDGAGVDVEVSYRGQIPDTYIRHVQLNFQLKATTKNPGDDPEFLSYFMQDINRYNKLRCNDSVLYKILAVLFLPSDASRWLTISHDELIMKNAAYWVCLYGAPESSNSYGQTIYLPRTNLLTPDSLLKLVNLAVNKNVPHYTQPKK